MVTVTLNNLILAEDKMKKSLLLISLCFLLVLLSGCGTKSVVEENSKETNSKTNNQEIEDKVEENGEIVKGTIEGYTFKVTDKKTDRVKIEMEDGQVILIVLSNKYTPKTIENFKKLVSEGFYDGLTFHRISKGFVIQTGDPTGTGLGGTTEMIKGEFSSNNVENNLSHVRGVVSMARKSWDPDSASSQFFICQNDAPSLDGDYASFGKVFAGMDVVDEIASVEVNGETPINPPVIKSIKFIEMIK